ncbi:hypothetical protein [Marinilabilia rubra]|uniref:Thioredoxin domain-containing protein n=1 Tax=Marinilabilia rubra TaxID=2162893 RepID=A0A2U2B7K6_9BACT|nr:hypothetical protein [Marinilabilia rubra]PWD99032.1 hypothetical protein DDZ16_12260 [Marinilabilia rubra]
MKVCYYIIVLFLITISCSEKSTSLKIPDQLASEINIDINEKNKIDKKIKILVFFDGNCPACFGIIGAVADNFPSIPLFAISNAVDTVSINYNFEKLNINGSLVYDPQDLFFQKNKSLLVEHQIFLLKGNIIIAKHEFLFDNSLKKTFETAIKKEFDSE